MTHEIKVGIAICTPMPVVKKKDAPNGLQHITVEWHRHRQSLGFPTNIQFYEIPADGMEIGDARNHAAKVAMEHNAEFLFFIDSDVLIQWDGLQKLLMRARHYPDHDIFTGIYCTKGLSQEPLIYKVDGEGPCWDWTVGDLVFDLASCGMGCCLIRMSLFEKLEFDEDTKPWFFTPNDRKQTPTGFETNRGTEDIFFCRRARNEADAKIMADLAATTPKLFGYDCAVVPFDLCIEAEALGRDLIGKVAGGRESHGAPPGYYLLTYSLFVWPFGFLALVGGTNALRRMRTDARLLFCVAWYLPFFVVFELIPTKLPHYMLAAYPAILLMGAWYLTLGEQPLDAPLLWQRVLHGLGAFGTGLVAVGLAIVAVGLPIYLHAGFRWQGLAAAILILLAGWVALVNIIDLTPMRRILAATLAASVAYCALFSSVLPGLDRLWLNRQIAHRFVEEKPCETSVLGSLSFHEPSLVFLIGTDRVQNLRPHDVAEFVEQNGACGVIAMSDKDAASVFASVPGGLDGLAPGAPIVGVNYSKGRELQIRLYRMKP